MADATLQDEADRKCLISAFDLIERLVQLARGNMHPDGRADLVDGALQQIEFVSRYAQNTNWPDLQARALEAARRDKVLQRALKKAARKTPI